MSRTSESQALYDLQYRQYQTPLTSRYASREMSYNFSGHKKFSTWRKLWLSLATVQQELGVTEISQDALAQMADHLVGAILD